MSFRLHYQIDSVALNIYLTSALILETTILIPLKEERYGIIIEPYLSQRKKYKIKTIRQHHKLLFFRS